MTTVQLTPGVEISKASLMPTLLLSVLACFGCCLVAALSDGRGVTSMLRKRLLDSKVNVRKAALLAFEQLLRLDTGTINQDVNEPNSYFRLHFEYFE